MDAISEGFRPSAKSISPFFSAWIIDSWFV